MWYLSAFHGHLGLYNLRHLCLRLGGARVSGDLLVLDRRTASQVMQKFFCDYLKLCRKREMTQSAAEALNFYEEVAASKKLWALKDADGFPAPLNADGKRAQPFWSSLSRVEKIIRTVPAYAKFEPYELGWQEFSDRWMPALMKDGILVGVKWSGKNATGYDIAPEEVKQNVEQFIST